MYTSYAEGADPCSPTDVLCPRNLVPGVKISLENSIKSHEPRDARTQFDGARMYRETGFICRLLGG